MTMTPDSVGRLLLAIISGILAGMYVDSASALAAGGAVAVALVCIAVR